VRGSPKSGNFAAFKGDLAIERRWHAEDDRPTVSGLMTVPQSTAQTTGRTPHALYR
jgi:hypothetical protein